MQQMIRTELISHENVVKKVIDNLQNEIKTACEYAVNTIKNGNKIILMGNGGSAADAQHIAAEFTGRYKTDRKGLPAIALTTDTSALTAIGNDFGFDYIFERQIEAIANKNDLVIGISTSGKSKNILRAFKKSKEKGCINIGLSGNGGGEFNELCNLNLIVPSDDIPRIQEMHILIGHIICQSVDSNI